jgi:hypothetical protein
MKKLNLLISAFILISALIKSQNNNSITVFTEGGEPFYLIINGLKQNTKAETNVKASGINGQQVKAKVIFDQQGIPDCDKTIPMMWAAEPLSNTEFVFSIKKNRKGQYKWDYVSHSPIQTSNVNSNQNNNLGQQNNNQNGQAEINNNSNQNTITSTTTSSTITTSGNNNQNNGVGLNIGVNGMGINMNMNVNDGTSGNNLNTTTSTTTTSYTTTTMNNGVSQTNTGVNISSNSGNNNSSNINNNSNQNISNNNTCLNAMSATDFNGAKNSVQSKPFDDTRLKIAKQVADNNCLSVEQIKGLMSIFSFEENKLNFAKYAYDHCTEKRNYYKVGDAFSFDSNVQELSDYVNSKK